MTYDEAVRYLLTLGSELAAPRQPAMAGTAGARVAKFDLRNTTVLADRLRNPHRAYPCVHIAGTNGKGSTAAMLASILQQAGLATGLYTSPHLERINERIRIAGEEISDGDFAETFARLQAWIEVLLASGSLAAHPTYFECLTAMAFDYFARQKADFAVFEVGMGGRLDATNVVVPEVSVITQIDFDHENFLGHSIEQIAGEKAGILKPGVPVVCAAGRREAREVVARRAAELDAPLVDLDEVLQFEAHSGQLNLAPTAAVADSSLRPTELACRNAESPAPVQRVVLTHRREGWRISLDVPLRGRFQLRNAATAVLAARVLRERGFRITDDAVAGGIAAVRWAGRLELLQRRPDVYLDGTHNPAGARELLAFWEEQFAGRRIHLVYGAMRDKAVDEITGLLFPHVARVVLTAPKQARAISAAALAEMSGHLAHSVEVIPEPGAALARAIATAEADDAVFATGSLYLAGDLRHWWKAQGGARAELETVSAAVKVSR